MKQYGRKSIFAYLTALLVLSSVEQTRATGFVDIWAGGMGSCSAKTSFGELSLDVGKLNDLVLRKNCAYQRDVMGILPFIEKNLSEIYSKIGRRIVFASYQAGFFPYHLRELFSEKQVFFLDTVGLANLDISKVSGIKNSIGHVDGTKIDRLFCGESGVLSSAVKGYNVDLIYALGISNEDKKRMQDCNYQVIYERPGAIVFADMSLPTDVLALFPSRK